MNADTHYDKKGGIPAQQNEGAGISRQGETQWSQVAIDGKQTPAAKQPNERDESASSQGAQNASMSDIGKLAQQDAETRLDTDRGPVLDAVYNGPVTEGNRK